MELKFISKRKLKLARKLSKLDEFVIDFVKHLKVKYVIVSGYVPILFGRSRVTEDIDMLIEKVDLATFKKIITRLERNGFWAINTDDKRELYEMLRDNLAIRIAKKRKVIPNIEIKFVKSEDDRYCLDNPLTILVNDKRLFISPMEIQIAYKFYLGSEKDIGDAIHLYTIFKENLNTKLLNLYLSKLKVSKLAKKMGVKSG
jgi:hypothetical protein